MSAASTKEVVLSTIGTKAQFEAVVKSSFANNGSGLDAVKPIIDLICSYVSFTRLYVMGGTHWTHEASSGLVRMSAGPDLTNTMEVFDANEAIASKAAAAAANSGGDLPLATALPLNCGFPSVTHAGRSDQRPTKGIHMAESLVVLNPDNPTTGAPWLVVLAGSTSVFGFEKFVYHFDLSLLAGVPLDASASAVTTTAFPSGWSKALPDLPEVADYSAAYVNHQIYAFSNRMDVPVQVLNLQPGSKPDERKWRSIENQQLSKVRNRKRCAVIGNRIYVCGGVWAGSVVRKTDVFDTKSETFVAPGSTGSVPDFPDGNNGCILAIGHALFQFVSLNAVRRIDPSRGDEFQPTNKSFAAKWGDAFADTPFASGGIPTSVLLRSVHMMDGALYAVCAESVEREMARGGGHGVRVTPIQPWLRVFRLDGYSFAPLYRNDEAAPTSPAGGGKPRWVAVSQFNQSRNDYCSWTV